jgi:NitT/TauT family transport system substrate-binding protein
MKPQEALVRRSQLLAYTGAALAAARLPAGAQTLDPVRFGSVGVEEAAVVYYAQEKGLFKQAGLNVDLSMFPNGGSVTQGMLGGAIDCGVTNSGSMSSAHVRGLPLSLVACGALYSQASPIAHLVVNKTLGIRSAKDLSGKTLAVSTLRDMIQATGMQWIDRNGGDSKTVNFVEIPMPQHDAAINAKRVDGSIMVEPIYSQARLDVAQMGLTYAAVNNGKPFQTLGIAANRDWATKNPAIAKKVQSAIPAAAVWANNAGNREECVQLLIKLTKVEVSAIRSYPRLAFAERNDPAYVQPVIDLMTKYGILPSRFSASELFAPGLG